MSTGPWDSERNRELIQRIAAAVPEGQCPTCSALFEGTEAICWFIQATQGPHASTTTMEAGRPLLATCPNAAIVTLVNELLGPPMPDFGDQG